MTFEEAELIEALRKADDALFAAQKLFLGPSEMCYELAGVKIAQARTRNRSIFAKIDAKGEKE